MKIKCEYCDNYFDDSEKVCPSCGAQNAHYVEHNGSEPKTIEELRQWYIARNLPPENETRFFIGKDIREARAFGIYKDPLTGNFVVYKNKDTGVRAIRYEGTDEAYAVNELYLKLKSEILRQKERAQRVNEAYENIKSFDVHNPGKAPSKLLTSIRDAIAIIGSFVALVFSAFVKGLLPAIIIGLVVWIAIIILWAWNFNGTKYEFKKWWHFVLTYVLVVVIAFPFCRLYVKSHEPKYYKYNDTVYYSRGSDFYEFDYDYGDYTYIGSKDALPVELKTNLGDYEWDTNGVSWDSGIVKFEDSQYYSDHYSSDSSDSDYDWDSGDSWDSGGSDWGSDW